jgi:hypothetical protein
LQQPKICSHDMHLPQVHSTMSGLDGSNVVGKHLYIQHLQFFSHAVHSIAHVLSENVQHVKRIVNAVYIDVSLPR